MTHVGKRLKLAREARGFFSTDALAKAVGGVSQPTIWKIETGKINQTRKINKIANFLKINPLWLAGEIGEDNLIIDSDSGLYKELASSSVTGITVRGTVKAGLWAEALEWPEEDQYPIPFDQNVFNDYSKDKVYALQVQGDSMDKEYKEGTYLYCVPAEFMGRKIETGDHVIVERQHAGKYECTVKEIEIKQDKSIMLWPRSHNPDHQAAIVISDALIANRSDHTIITVKALVIGHFYRRPLKPIK